MKQYKVAVIGCGWIGLGAQLDLLRPKPASHSEAIMAHPRLELAAFLDSSENALAEAKKLYPQASVFAGSPEELYKAIVPDAVVISTDPGSHCSHIIAAANAGVKLILCEKPISHSVTESEEAIEACKMNNSILLVNHMRRFDSVIRQFRGYVQNEYVKDTLIGKVCSVVASYDNGLYHGGTHIVDLLRYFLGEVVSVSAVKNNQRFQSASDDLVVDAVLQFKECNAMLYYFNSKEYALAEASFYGEKGSIHLRNMWGIDIEVVGTKSSLEFSAYRQPDYESTKRFGGVRSFMTGTYDHLVNCLDGTETPLCSGDDALKTLYVLKMIEASAANNGRLVSHEKFRQKEPGFLT